MSGIKTVFLKEMKRIFTDRRMLFALFMPGFIIFVVYNIMGKMISSSMFDTNITNSTYNIAYSDNSGVEKPTIISYFDAYLESEEKEKTNDVSYSTFAKSELGSVIDEVKAGT